MSIEYVQVTMLELSNSKGLVLNDQLQKKSNFNSVFTCTAKHDKTPRQSPSVTNSPLHINSVCLNYI